MHRLIAVTVMLALAPVAHAQSLGEVSAAMAVHDGIAGANLGGGSTARHARDKVKSGLASASKSSSGKGWQAGSRSERHSASSAWAGSVGPTRRGVRTTSGWATAHAGGGWAKRDSRSQRTR
jgi:hypothetical protein